MSWNYRVIRHEGDQEEWHAIHEVYYDDEGEPSSVTKKPVTVRSQRPIYIEADLGRMQEALDKPVLDYSSFEE